MHLDIESKAMQNKLKIKQILWLGFSTIFALIIIVNLIVEKSKSRLIKSLDEVGESYRIQQNLEEFDKTFLEAETSQRAFIYTNQPRFLELYQQFTEELKTQLAKLNQLITNENQQENLVELETITQKRLELLTESINLEQAGKSQEARAIISRDNRDFGQQLRDDFKTKLAQLKQLENELLEEKKQIATRAQNLTTYLTWGSTLLIIGIGAFISWAITRIISDLLQQAIGVAEQVSAGNLMTEVEANSHTEIGKLLIAIRSMIHNLNALIFKVQQSGIQVTTSSTQIAASGKQLEATVTQQVASINEVVATTQQIAATSDQLVQTIKDVTDTSHSTAIAALEGQHNLGAMETTMRQLTAATSSISNKLGLISEKANNINSIITTITKVADQTNLLSLNAAIEAEKAGEYGLGFAVVAREIRRLAEQTAVATLDIENMVKEMQSAVSTGVMEMDKFTKEVGHSAEDVRGVSQQLTEIIEQVQALTPRFQLVNQGMEVQSQGAQQINESMMQLSEASTQTAESLREINGAIEQLNEVAQGLRQEISRFKVGG
jgi:methyl-accepting chemotaxis protein WspA